MWSIRKILLNLHKDLRFLLERKKIEKCKKLVYGIEDNEQYVVHLRALKQALNHWLILNKKSAQLNSVESTSMVKTIHWNEY